MSLSEDLFHFYWDRKELVPEFIFTLGFLKPKDHRTPHLGQQMLRQPK